MKHKKILPILSSALLSLSLFAGPVATKASNSQIPELTAYQKNNHAKIEWAIDILDENVLIRNSFEDGEYIPYFVWGYSNKNGGQSITTETAFSGSRSIKIFNTVANGNWYNYPSTSSQQSIMTWQRLYFDNGTPLSVTFRAKTDSQGTIGFLGDGGFANSIKNVGNIQISSTAYSGANTIRLTSVDGLKQGDWITTDTDPSFINGMYQITNVNTSNKTITVNGNLNRTLYAGENLKTRDWRSPWSFPSRTVYASDGWKLFSVNTFVANYADYDAKVRGGVFDITSQTGGKLYIDDIKFGYATRVQLYRGNTLIYDGYLSDYEDKQATDKAKPNAISEVQISFDKGKPKFTWNKPVDNGTNYSYKIRAIAKNGQSHPFSSVKTVNVKSDIAGYSFIIDKNPRTEPDNIIDTTDMSYQHNQEIDGNFYLHIKAIDKTGNASDTKHILISDNTNPTLNYSLSIEQPTNKNITINIDTNDVGYGVKGIKLPNGNFIYNDKTTFIVDKNGSYEFVVEDNLGNTKKEVVEVKNIDKVAPAKPTFKSATYDRRTNNLEIQFDESTDVGLGMKGYSVVVDTKPNTIPSSTIHTVKGQYTITKPFDQDFYVHIRAIDKAGNLSGTEHMRIGIRNEEVKFDINTKVEIIKPKVYFK